MMVHVKLSALKQTSWQDYLMRFLFGAVATVLTGVISTNFGAAVGGLFLAFPAIFPASATLVNKHERQRKQRLSLKGRTRGRGAVGLEAIGAARGSCGMIGFGLAMGLFSEAAPWMAPVIALSAWMAISLAAWSSRHLF